MARKTEVQSCGSKWAGQKADSIQKLFQVLGNHPLDRRFEEFGNFIEADPVNVAGERLLSEGGVSFFGNFFDLSHVFSIDTTDQKLIARLTAAIRANQQRADYLAQEDYATAKARDEAARRERDRIKQEESERAARRVLGMEAVSA